MVHHFFSTNLAVPETKKVTTWKRKFCFSPFFQMAISYKTLFSLGCNWSVAVSLAVYMRKQLNFMSTWLFYKKKLNFCSKNAFSSKISIYYTLREKIAKFYQLEKNSLKSWKLYVFQKKSKYRQEKLFCEITIFRSIMRQIWKKLAIKFFERAILSYRTIGKFHVRKLNFGWKIFLLLWNRGGKWKIRLLGSFFTSGIYCTQLVKIM